MSYHLGVDLGTTYTAAALARHGRAEPLTLGTSSVAVPSVAYLGDSGEVLFGQVAVRRALAEPSRVAREFKRRVGDPTPIVLGGTPIPAEMLMARHLAWVVDQVAAAEGERPAGLAVTHPANWGQYKLDLLGQAIRHVGLEVAQFVPEPVAAATFYASQRDLAPGSIVAVYDLGGGTFDAALVRSEAHPDREAPGGQDQPRRFAIVGQPDGIERLGGIDFDHAVLRHVAETIDLDLDTLDRDDVALAAALGQLRLACVEAKEALSSDTDASVPVMLPNRHTEVRLTRAEFEGMIRPVLDETLVALRRTISSAAIPVGDITAVLLVGGSSRIPLVDQLVATELGRPTAVDARPKDAIALGAALGAALAATRAAPGGSPVAPAPGPEVTSPMPAAPAVPLPAEPLAGSGDAVPPTLAAVAPRSPWLWVAVAAVLLVGVGVLTGILVAGGGDDGELAVASDGGERITPELSTTAPAPTTAPTETATTSHPTTTAPTTTTITPTTVAPSTTSPPATEGKPLTVDGSSGRWSGSCFYEAHGTSRPVMASPGKCIDVGPDFYDRTAPHGSTEHAVCWRPDVSIQDNQLNSSDIWLQLDDGGWMSSLYFVEWRSARDGLPAC